jgi:hypothetical protein
LEYGGSHGSSRISELSSNSVGLPNLHFLMVELDDHAVLKALCEGVEMPPYTEILLVILCVVLDSLMLIESRLYILYMMLQMNTEITYLEVCGYFLKGEISDYIYVSCTISTVRV